MDWVGAVEEVYQPCANETVWAQRVLQLAGRMFPTVTVTGVSIVRHDASCSAAELLVSVATDDACAADARRLVGFTTPPAIRKLYYPETVVTSMSSILPRLPDEEQAQMRGYLARYASRDSIGLVVHPEPGVAGVIFSGFAEEHVPTPPERQLLTQFAMHCETSLRLLRRPEVVRAIISPDGRILHGAGHAPALPAQVRDIERARTQGERDERDALGLWSALVDGEVSVVERFDGGKRLYFVIENAPVTQPLRALTPREVDILSLSARGLSAKMVAYTLGIAGPTVSNALGSTARKIGLSTRLELVRIAAMLVRDPRARFVETALSEAERDVLDLLAQGLTNQEIASLRGRSIRTIANQVSSLLRKTGSSSRRALATTVTGR